MKIKIKNGVEGRWYKPGEEYDVDQSQAQEDLYVCRDGCIRKEDVDYEEKDVDVVLGQTSWTGPDGHVYKIKSTDWSTQPLSNGDFEITDFNYSPNIITSPIVPEVGPADFEENGHQYWRQDRQAPGGASLCSRGTAGMYWRLKKEEDRTNPNYYKSHPSGVECIQITEHYNYCIGNAIKYLWRNGLKVEEGMDTKEKQIEDLKKAIWYIRREIKNLDPNELP